MSQKCHTSKCVLDGSCLFHSCLSELVLLHPLYLLVIISLFLPFTVYAYTKLKCGHFMLTYVPTFIQNLFCLFKRIFSKRWLVLCLPVCPGMSVPDFLCSTCMAAQKISGLSFVELAH